MDNVGRTGSSSGRWAIIGGLTAAALAVAVLVGMSAWQTHVRDSDLDQVQSRTAVAASLKDAGDEAAVAATSLRQYVKTGDDALIPDIKGHSSAAVTSLTTAVSQGGETDLSPIAESGARLAQQAGQVIALRQSGDAATAAAALQQMSPAFDAATAQTKDAITTELQSASSLQNAEHSADTLASWLLVAALVTAGVLTLSLSAMGARWIISRRNPKMASTA